MNLKIRILATSIAVVLLISCEREEQEHITPLSIEKLQGHVQKGPFLNGTSVSIAELNAEFGQTGRTFQTQISDNLGSFEMKHIELATQFVELKADGFYFNEVSGEGSTARLILNALSDLTDRSTLNANVLTHLEKDRILYLMEEGMDFSDAKVQAQAEVLQVFSIQKADMPQSEQLDISGSGDDHAILLAVSLILQGYRTVAELSELLADINTDIREDGKLDDPVSGTALVNHATIMNLAAVRQNLESRFREQELVISVADFEKFVHQFLENTDYEVTSLIDYPEFSDYGENILFLDKSEFVPDREYSMAADLPLGAQLKIRLSGGLWYYRVMPNGPVNWHVAGYNDQDSSQVFTSIEPGTPCDLTLKFSYYESITDTSHVSTGSNKILVEYFEYQAEAPTRTKVINLQ
jgi:hypothetical protein